VFLTILFLLAPKACYIIKGSFYFIIYWIFY